MGAGKSRPNPGKSFDGRGCAGDLAVNTTGVGHLTTRFEVERGSGERDVPDAAARERIGRLSLFVEKADDRDAGNAGARVSLEVVARALERFAGVCAKFIALFVGAEIAAGPRL